MRGSSKIQPEPTMITKHEREPTEFTFRRNDPKNTTISNFNELPDQWDFALPT